MIALGCDHGGYELMQEVIKHLEERGLEYKNFGCYSTESVDYPVYGDACCCWQNDWNHHLRNRNRNIDFSE